MTVAYNTELANILIPTDVISAGISAALVQAAVVVPLIYAEDLPAGTNVKKFRKAGSLTAEAVSESAPYTFSASSEYTESSVTVTAVKSAVASLLTVEAEQFSSINLARLAAEQGQAIARLLDDDVLTLFDEHNNSVTCGSILTVDDILTAAYTVRAAVKGASKRKLIGVFDYKGINEIRKELVKSAASVFSIPEMVSLLRPSESMQTPNGYVGSLPGIDLFETDGLPSANSDDYALVFNPDLCYCAMYSPSVQVRTRWVGASQYGESAAPNATGFATEVASWVFSDVKEWNDTAGCTVRSDT